MSSEPPVRCPVKVGFDVMPYEEGMEWASARFGSAELHLFGVSGRCDPYETDYGMCEAVHVDLDNSLIRFGSPLKRA